MSSARSPKLVDTVGRVSQKERLAEWVYTASSGLLSVALLWPVAFRGWVPHDEGTLGQAAIRVLDGQWPHVDFLDVYPGLLAVVHAGVFWVLGESIASLRVVWLGVVALAAMCLFYLARQRMDRRRAIFASVALVVLAFVIYPASMPTWWNLSLGLAALALTYFGWFKARAGYVLAAGLLTGSSILIKTTGGAFIAMALFLWLISTSEHRYRWYAHLATGTAVFAVVVLIAPVMSPGRVLLLGIPAGLAVLLLRPLARIAEDDDRTVIGRTANLPWWFASGVLSVPALALAGYASVGELDALLRGWVSSPALRFESAEVDVPIAAEVLFLILMAVAAGTLVQRVRVRSGYLSVGLVGALTAWGLLDWFDFGRIFFSIVTWTAPLVALVLFLWRGRLKIDRLGLLVVAAALLFTLIQIPMWNGYYAAYTVPMLGLSVLLLTPPHRLLLALSLFGVTASLFLLQSLAGRLDGPVALDEPISYVELANPRAGISVPVTYGYYSELAMRVSEVAGDRPIYAGPDAPEVAFLAGVESATGGFFEVLDPDWDYGIAADLARDGSAIVVNTTPKFSDPISEDVLAEIHAVNKNQATIGQFTLTWSDTHE